jgi:hypothetical protein
MPQRFFIIAAIVTGLGGLATAGAWMATHCAGQLLPVPSAQLKADDRAPSSGNTIMWTSTVADDAEVVKSGERSDAKPAASHKQAAAGRETIASSHVLQLPPVAPAARAPDWVEAERRLADLRQARQEWGVHANELRVLYAQMADPKTYNLSDYPPLLDQLSRWQAEFPRSAAPLVVAANANIAYAWQARGSGTADTVTAEGWALFRARIQESQRLLKEALKLGPEDGEVYRALITIGLATSVPKAQARAWLRAGQKLDPTYFPMYEQMAVYLLPRWQGEPGDVEQFASELAASLPGDDGLEAAAAVALTVNNLEWPTNDTLFYGQYDRELLMRAAETLLRRHDGERYAQFAALCALATQDHAAAQRIRPVLTRFDANHKVWLWETSYKKFRNWSAASDCPHGEESWIWSSEADGSGIAFHDANHVWCDQQYGRWGARLTDIRSRQTRAILPHPGGAVNVMAVDRRRDWIVLASWRGKFVGWSLFDLAADSTPITHATAEKCDCLAIHPQEPRVFWTEGKTLRSWDFKAEKAGPQIELPAPARKLCFSPDGSVLAAQVNRIVVYDPEAGTIKAELVHSGMKPPPALDCRWLLGVDDQGRVLAAGQIGKPIRSPVVRFAADGKTWETLLADVRSNNCHLSPDGRLVGVVRALPGGPSAIAVWDLESRKRIKYFDGHWNRIGQIAFSPDNRKMASIATEADAIRIWSLADAIEK